MELEGVTVLLVEDDNLVALMVEDMLADLGCTLAARAQSVDEAIDKVLAGGFKCALLDVNLHGKEVFPVAEILSERGIPFVFSSGNGAAGLPAPFRGRPSLPKPFQLDDLAAVLSAALATSPDQPVGE